VLTAVSGHRGKLSDVGDAVGSRRRPSRSSEPGTHLRRCGTFHSGGVAGGDITITQVFRVVVELFEARTP